MLEAKSVDRGGNGGVKCDNETAPAVDMETTTPASSASAAVVTVNGDNDTMPTALIWAATDHVVAGGTVTPLGREAATGGQAWMFDDGRYAVCYDGETVLWGRWWLGNARAVWGNLDDTSRVGYMWHRLYPGIGEGSFETRTAP